MKKIYLAVLMCVLSVDALAQTSGSAGRYMILVAPQGDGKGSHAVFRLDTTTGRVSYCTPRLDASQPQPAAPILLQCVHEAK